MDVTHFVREVKTILKDTNLLRVWAFIPLFRLLYTYNQSMQRFTAHAADSLQEARENYASIMRTANELRFDYYLQISPFWL